MPLEPDQQLHITVAQGYVGLGMYLDADGASTGLWCEQRALNPLES